MALGLIDQAQADSAHAQRNHLVWCISQFLITHNLAERTNGGEPAVELIAAAVLRWLAGTDAWAVLVNLEDLLGEERPQNVPGTYRERPNWLRKATETLEGLLGSGHIEAALRAVDAARKGTG